MISLGLAGLVACAGPEDDADSDTTVTTAVGLTTSGGSDETTSSSGAGVTGDDTSSGSTDGGETTEASSDGSSDSQATTQVTTEATSDPTTGATSEATSDPTTDPTTDPSTSDSDGYDGEPGEFVLTFDQRDYRLYVPGSYAPGVAAPIVLGLHGAGDTGANFYAATKATGWTAASEASAFLFVVPDTKSPYSDFANWSGNPQNDIDEMIAELGELLALVDELGVHYHLDPKQAHLFGFSNGGLVTAFAGMSHADSLASLAVIGYGWGPGYVVTPPRKIAVQFLCGTGDSFHSYATGSESYLASQGHPTRMESLNGVGHDLLGIMAAVPPSDVFAWMSGHPLP